MLNVQLGNTSSRISKLSFGGASLSGEGGGYGFGEVSESQAERLIKTSIDLGIKTFDTAPIYGFGLSELRLGKYLPKDGFVITKGGVDWHENKRVNMSNHPEVIKKMLHESLIRLNRETIDLYMIHWPDPQIDIRKPLEVLVKAQAEGKIRHLGLCNTTPDDLELASQITRIELVQSQFNYFSQNDFKSLRPQLSSKNLSFMSWGTFDKGILSGRVQINSKFDSSDARSWAPWWKSQNLKGKLQEVEKLKFFASSIDLTLSQLALAWQFIYPEISSSLIGWKTIEDLNQSLSDLQKISHSHIEKIKLFAEN